MYQDHDHDVAVDVAVGDDDDDVAIEMNDLFVNASALAHDKKKKDEKEVCFLGKILDELQNWKCDIFNINLHELHNTPKQKTFFYC